MRILIIRNAETITYNESEKVEGVDPDITTDGKEDSLTLGKFLKENGFKIDKFFLSPARSSISTTQQITNSFNDTAVELLIDLHEFGGVYLNENNKVYRGMTKTEISDKFTNISFPEDLDLNDGWWKEESEEAEVKFTERVRRVILKVKELAIKSEEEYTICLITHPLFMNNFFSILTNTEVLMTSKNSIFSIIQLDLNFGFANLSVSSLTISRRKEVKIEFLNFLLKSKQISEN